MTFPDRAQRKACWDARDDYWKCLDQENIKEVSHEAKPCLDFRKLFEKSCPLQWVTHFDRKRNYNVFKEQMEKGYDPLDQK